jgi:DNA-binding IclR family transcriptional regulator
MVGAEEREEEGKQPLYFAPALDKGLDILELMSKQREGLTRREIAERLGRSVGEIFRMIESLTRRSYLVQDDDKFLLGMKVFELTHEFPPMSRLLHEALPRMEALSKFLDQSCHLTVLSGTHQLVVAQVDIPDGVGFSVRIGAKLDLLTSASGQVLLAFHDREDAGRLVQQVKETASKEERDEFLIGLDGVRSRGFARITSNRFGSVEAISYPVLDLQGRAIAALTVPFMNRLDDPVPRPLEFVQSYVATVAADLSASLGGAITHLASNVARGHGTALASRTD